MERAQTRYAKSGGVHIAYQVLGQGPLDIVFVQGFISNLEVQWEDARLSHLLTQLAGFGRLILFDKRGCGLSDPVAEMPTLHTRMDDVRAVMDAAGSRQAVLIGASDGGPLSILFGATYPARTRALVLYGAYAHFLSAVQTREQVAAFIAAADANWGNGASLPHFVPGMMGDAAFRSWWARFERLGATPAAAIALARMNSEIDVRPVLPHLLVPTLVLHRCNDVRVNAAAGRDLAANIRGARHVELPGSDHPIWLGDTDRVLDEIRIFLGNIAARPSNAMSGASRSCPADSADGQGSPAARSALTPREREVVDLIACGCTNPAIAAELRVSAHTVKRHVANILLKLDVPTRSAAAVRAFHHPAR